MLRYLSVIAVVCLVLPAARPEDKPDYSKLIVGKWEVTKADPGTAPVGSTVEFMKDGKAKAMLKIGGEAQTIEGTYSLHAAKLKVKFGDKVNDWLTISKVSETVMSVKNKDGKELTVKRMK